MKNIAIICSIGLLLSACSDAEIASSNLSRAADNFEINRRIVFYNGITNDIALTMEGLCSLGKGEQVKAVTVTCKTGPSNYKKHYMGLSDNMTYVAEQLEAAPVGTYHYRVIWKPLATIPAIEIK